MSDFFGGIMDGLKGITGDAMGFLDGALDMVGLTGSDIVKAAGAALKDNKIGGSASGATSTISDNNIMSTLNGGKYQASKSEAQKSVDPKEMEANWIRRIQLFTQES